MSTLFIIYVVCGFIAAIVYIISGNQDWEQGNIDISEGLFIVVVGIMWPAFFVICLFGIMGWCSIYFAKGVWWVIRALSPPGR